MKLIKIDDYWSTSTPSIKINSTWVPATDVYVKKDGVLVKTYDAGIRNWHEYFYRFTGDILTWYDYFFELGFK